MIAIDLHGGRAAAFRFLDALRLVRLAVSLGGVESLACHLRTRTASEMSEEDLRASGVTEGLVRLSVGVEYWKPSGRRSRARARGCGLVRVNSLRARTTFCVRRPYVVGRGTVARAVIFLRDHDGHSYTGPRP